MTRDPVTIRADDAGRRGAEHHGAAQDHVDRRRRRRRAARRRRRAPARPLADGDGRDGRDQGRRAEIDSPIAGRAHQADAVRRRRRADRRPRASIHADGTESKTFGIRDGIAMVWAQRAGLKVGFLSARLSPTTPHRAAQLGITLVYHGVASKLATYEQILARPRPHRRRGRLHGRRHRRSGGAGARRAGRRARRRRAPRSVARALGQQRGRRARRRPRADRADPARAGPLGRRRRRRISTSRATPAQPSDERLRAAARGAGRAARRPDDRQGVGALQAARRQVDRSPPRPRVAALHPRPEFPGRQPDRSGDRGADAGPPASTPTRSKST